MADWLSAAGGLASGLLNMFSANQSQLRAYQYSKALQNHQNAYSTKMWNKQVKLLNTAHQREVKDLRSAGLNPILTATGGNGAGIASTPSAGSASQSPVDPQLGEAVSSALDFKRYQLEKDLNKANVNNVTTDTARKEAEIDNLDQNTHYINSQDKLLNEWQPVLYAQQLAGLREDVRSKEITNSFLHKKFSAELRAIEASIRNQLANARYTSKRSLGFSETRTESVGSSSVDNKYGWDLGAIRGTYYKPSTNTSRSYSYSRTY